MKQCIKCKATLEDDELFCHECGTKQEMEETRAGNQVEEPIASEAKFCIYCGEEIEADSMFCPFCGKSQDVDEVKAEESQQEPSQDISEQDSSKEDIQPQEELVYEYEEEEEKPRSWLWILLTVLIAGGIGAWCYMNTYSNNSNSHQVPKTVSSDTIPISSEMEEINDVPSTPLAFLEQFYKGEIGDNSFIEQHVTANVLNKLKRDYLYECSTGDCLATWVFEAYPPGADLELDEGPIISSTDKKGRYKVDFKYSYYNGEQKGYETRTVYLTVKGIDSDYFISDYEVVDNSSMKTSVEEKELEDGKYTLTDNYMFLTMTKEGSALKGFFYFSRGTYCSPSYNFSCTMGSDNRFNASTYISSNYQGEISGILKGEIMNVKVNLELIDKNNGERELKVRK